MQFLHWAIFITGSAAAILEFWEELEWKYLPSAANNVKTVEFHAYQLPSITHYMVSDTHCCITLHWMTAGCPAAIPRCIARPSFAQSRLATGRVAYLPPYVIFGLSCSIVRNVKIIGVTPDQHLTFRDHVQNVFKSSNYHTRVLRHIHSPWTKDIARTAACALVNTRFYHCNSVLYHTTGSNIAKLQRAQNAIARVVTNTRRTEHIRPVLEGLHWLPINYRIDYKLAILTYKICATCIPAYLKPFIRDYVLSRQLRSSSMQLIMTEATKTEIARRSFSQAAPTVWNCLWNREIWTVQNIPPSKWPVFIHAGSYCTYWEWQMRSAQEL
jgi:hypothetical protein